MGAYLSKPICNKESEDIDADFVRVGASAMQGWRMSQEDAHCCMVDFDTNTSLFAVYDGHGGSEVAKYTADHFPEFLKKVSSYQSGQMAAALEDAFLGFDATLIEDEVKLKLVELAAGADGTDAEKENEDEDPNEAAVLREEATMPIEELLDRYGGAGLVINRISDLRKTSGKNLSPVIRAKPNKPLSEDDDNLAQCDSGEVTVAVVSDSKEQTCSDESDGIRLKLTDKILNGYCEDDTVCSSTDDTGKVKKVDEADHQDSSFTNGDTKTSENCDPVNSEAHDEKSAALENQCSPITSDVSVKVDGHLDDASKTELVTPDASAEGSSSLNVGEQEASSSSSVVAEQEASCSASAGTSSAAEENASSSAGPSTAKPENESSDEETTEEEADSDEDDQWNGEDSDSDSEDELGEDEDDDDEDDDDDDSGDAEEVEPGMEWSEEPGFDSGCTAVVALLRDNELYVANAGDSRCVLCRDGKAVEMSVDHKPEDTIEQDRILKAGGRVTCDGRVNGGLNLSRAIGDHTYKKNKSVADREQMITALPDVKSVILDELDEFMVLACDGIWNVMSSQDVVDFVRSRLKSGLTKLSAICEEMFDFCLAPDTSGDGTGCDNMTCVIVTFNGLTSCVAQRTGGKRKADADTDDSNSVEASTKRSKSAD